MSERATSKVSIDSAEPLPGAHSQPASDDWAEITQILALPVMHMPKVLLVDDDELVTERLKCTVVEAGYEVFTATNGAAALAALKQDFMSIVVLDRSMPGMDGLTLCRAIRQTHWQGYV